MGKVYAVRQGHKVGIFDTWGECQEATKGFSGAEFKSFSTVEQAEDYMRGTGCVDTSLPCKPDLLNEQDCNVYISGANNCGIVSFGVVVDGKNSRYIVYGKTTDNQSGLGSIAGELIASLVGVQCAILTGHKYATVFYKYDGIAKWLDEWACKGELQSNYRRTMFELRNRFETGGLRFAQASKFVCKEEMNLAKRYQKNGASIYENTNLDIILESHLELKDVTFIKL